MEIEKFLESWQEVLMNVSESELRDAISAGKTEDFDNKNYQVLSGLLVEPDNTDKWRSSEHMPDELLEEIGDTPINEYVRKYNLLDSNPYSDLWMELASIVDYNGY